MNRRETTGSGTRYAACCAKVGWRPLGCGWPRGMTGWLSVLAVVSFLLLAQGHLQAAPTTALQAQRAVQGWVWTDSSPLGTRVGTAAGRVDTHFDAQGREIYYVVYLDPSGFVIVSADDQLEPIVGFVASGTFDLSQDNPLGALVNRDMQDRMESVRFAPAMSGPAAEPDAEQGKWRRLTQAADSPPAHGDSAYITATPVVPSDVRVAPLIASRWSQTSEFGLPCYNYFTPNAYPCGCVATAMSQLMRFHQYPIGAVGAATYTIYVSGVPATGQMRGGDGAGGPYDWSLMALDPDAGITDAQRQAIGGLCYDAGLSVGMNYGPNGSGAYNLGEVALTSIFQYGNAIRGYNNGLGVPAASLYGMVNPNLDAGFPVLLGIVGTAGGHAILADGYGYNTSTLYHHLNLGWAGYQDAWYNLPKINSSPSFTAIFECGYNIYPAGTGEIISGRVLDMSSRPIAGATVTAQKAGGGTYTATTSSKGIYAMAKLPSSSTYTIRVSGPAGVFAPQTITTGASTNYASTAGNRWGVDFKAKPETPPTATGSTVVGWVNQATTISLTVTDDGRPVTGTLSCVILTLPTHGQLADPNGGPVSLVPYTLHNGGKQVVYSPAAGYTGADTFTFKANDGGLPPTGGNSKVAVITLAVKAQVYSATMDQDPGWALDSGWAWGVPAGGGSRNHDPSAGFTGQNVIGYNLAGDYSNGISPVRYATTSAIDCRGYCHLKLSFYRWLGLGASAYDRGSIQVSNDGTHWTSLWVNGTAEIVDATWLRMEFDISKLADGKATVYVRWGMGPTSLARSTYPGWNIDDVSVYGDYYAPSVQFAKPASSGREETASASLPVVLSGRSLRTVTIQYAIKGGTATSGVDYSLNAGTLQFDPGQTTQNIPITVVDDSIREANETIQVVLSKPINATLGTSSVHTYTIIENDPIDNNAGAELTVAGTRTGTFVNTRGSDNACESIHEVIKAKTTYTQLEHRWTFSVTGGAAVTFNLEAYCTASAESDTFVFAYSTNGSVWKDMVTVTKTADDDACQTFALPAPVKGTVYVRVRNTNRVAGKTGLDAINIDNMFFHCQP